MKTRRKCKILALTKGIEYGETKKKKISPNREDEECCEKDEEQLQEDEGNIDEYESEILNQRQEDEDEERDEEEDNGNYNEQEKTDDENIEEQEIEDKSVQEEEELAEEEEYHVEDEKVEHSDEEEFGEAEFKEDLESEQDSSDSDLDELVQHTLNHMKKVKSESLVEFISLNKAPLSGPVDMPSSTSMGRRSSGITKNKRSSMPRKGSIPNRERMPAGLDTGLDMKVEVTNQDNNPRQRKFRELLDKSRQDKLLEKSILQPDIEKKHSLPPYSVSKHQEWKKRKKIRDSSTGDSWYNMKAAEMTPELQNNLKIIQMRSVLDPKRFYRNNDMKTVPKFVQLGTVMDSPVDFYHARVTKKERRNNLVDELLADADSRRYNKRKYMDLQYRRSSSKKRRSWNQSMS